MARFAENRDKFPAEDLLPFTGQTIAWWLDGSRIVDAADDLGSLLRKLKDRGVDPSFVVFEDILPF